MFAVTQYTGFSARRSSGAPPSTPTLVGWYDFSDTSNLTTSGTSISTAVDKSASGFNATQGTASMMPTYSAAVQNGLSAALFAATTSGLTNPRLNIGAGQLSTKTSPAFAFAAVARSTATSIPNALYLYRGSGGVNQFPDIHWNGSVPAGTATAALQEIAPDGSIVSITGTYAAWHIFSFVMGTGSGTFNLDGTGSSATGLSTGSSGTSAWGVLGEQVDNAHVLSQQNGWAGYIGEVRIFDSNIGTAALQKEEGYLAWKWGLQGNLPANHPYKNGPP